jgi:hypothetical protein
MFSNQSSSRFQRRAFRWIGPVLGSLLMLPMLPTILDFQNSTQQSQLRPSVEEPISNSERTAAAWGIAVLGLGVLGLGWKSFQQSSLASTNRLGRTTASANRLHQRQLLSLLHDDRQAAERLINQVQQNHPDRSIDWCVEKAIYDLQRDRH